jgi:hypothetical protein
MKSVILAVPLLFFAWSALAEPDASPKHRYSLRYDQALPGSLYKDSLASNGMHPLTKGYEAFTPEEKAAVRSLYEGMPENDEPPFPKGGMRTIFREISKLVGQFRARGDLTIVVSVDTNGEASGVKIVKYEDLDFAKAVAYVLVSARYKPAVCSGSPCELEFPYRFSFK